MAEVLFRVTTDDVKYYIIRELDDLESNGDIEFEDDSQREDFINECIEEVVYRWEMQDDKLDYIPNWGDVVYDNAEANGLLKY